MTLLVSFLFLSLSLFLFFLAIICLHEWWWIVLSRKVEDHLIFCRYDGPFHSVSTVVRLALVLAGG
jgi:hypothetical protein